MINQETIDNKILDWISVTRLVNPITLHNQVINCGKRDIKNTVAVAFSMIERWDLVVSDVIMAPQTFEILKIFFKEIDKSYYLDKYDYDLWGAHICFTNIELNNIVLISDYALTNENLK